MKEWGVLLSLFLMDFIDNVNIFIYDVWGWFVEFLCKVFICYSVDNIIGVRVYCNDVSVIFDLLENVVFFGIVEFFDSVLDEEV